MVGTLAGKIAIVTGAGRGIGRAIAERLAAEGARVVVATRTASYGEDAVAAINAAGGAATLFALDVTDRKAVSALVADTAEREGRIDIIVHAAADIPHASIAELTDETLELCLTSILKSAVWLVRDSLPYLEKSQSGRVIFISSIAGNRRALAGLSHYGAAKAGLNAFARGAAVELGPKGITVNMIEPGLIASDNMRSMISPEMEIEMVADHPIKRAGTTQEVASAVLYLALPESAFINGASLVVDGGATL